MGHLGSRCVLLLSGPIAVGKTCFASELIPRYRFKKIRSGGFLFALATDRGVQSDRTGLQELGDALDAETDFRWVVEDVTEPALVADAAQTLWLFDAVRKHRQVQHFRARFGVDIFHLHLVASEEVLLARYQDRQRKGGEYLGSTPYAEAMCHPNEVESRSLSEIADLVLDAGALSPSQLAEELAREIGLRS